MKTYKRLVRTPEITSNRDFQSRQNQSALTRGELITMRAKAIRRGIWFKVLSKTERACIELTIRIVDKVRSHFLAQVLTSIKRKLLSVMKSRTVHVMEEIGYSIAQKLCQIALNWGNSCAEQWMKNRSFIQYLTVMHMNKNQSRSSGE